MTERNIFREKARVAVRRNKANMKANAMTDRAAIIEEEADWLVDAVGVAIYSNSKKAIEKAITRALVTNTTDPVKVLEALREYGAHKTTCNAYRSHATGEIRGGYRDLKDPRSYNEECTCGLTAALAAEAPPPPSSDDTELQNMGLVFDKVGNPAPPSTPERERVLEALKFARTYVEGMNPEIYTAPVDRIRTLHTLESAIAALEGK